jgi:hypothetical protein
MHACIDAIFGSVRIRWQNNDPEALSPANDVFPKKKMQKLIIYTSPSYSPSTNRRQASTGASSPSASADRRQLL